MKRIFPTLLIIVITNALFSQNCQNAIGLKTYGGNSSYNAIVDGGRRSDSLFTICGSYGSGSLNLGSLTLPLIGTYHYFLATSDTSGTVLNANVAVWYSNSSDYCVIKKMHIGVDNCVYITGYWKGSSVHIGDSLLPTVTVNRAFMARFDSNLQPVWVSHTSKTFADCQANGIASDRDKNVYVVGSFEDNIFKMGTVVADNYGGNNMWRDDAFLLKLDSTGAPVYVKHIGTPADDAGFGVVCDTSGGVYIFGHAGISTSLFQFDDQMAVPGGVAGSSLFYAKYDGLSGNCVWGRLGGSHFSSGYFNIYDIAMADNQSIIICGKIIGQTNLYPNTYTTYDENGYVAKFALNGDNIWLKTIGGQNSSEMATRVTYYNNKIGVCGSLYSNQPYLGDYPMYATVSGGSYRAFNATLDTNGNVIMARVNKLVSSSSDQYYTGVALIDDYEGQILWGNFKGSQTWYPLTSNNISSYGKIFSVRFAPVNATPALTVTAGPDKIASCGTSVQLNGAITPTSNVAFGWYPDLGFSSNGSKTPYVNPGRPTTYILYATYNGCTLTDTVQVTYSNHDIAISLPESYTFCAGDSVQLNLISNQSTATYSWGPTAYINTATSQNPYVKPPLTTQYVVTATYNGCVASDTVTVFSRPKPYIALPKMDMYNMWRTHLCQFDTLDINFGDPNYTYTTTTPGQLINFYGNTAQLLPISGVLRMQAVSQYGCTSSDSLGVVVHNNLPAPIVTGTVINREKCPGDTAYFNVTLTNSANINFQYSWYAGWQVDSLNGNGWSDIDYYDSNFEITNYSVGYPSSTYYSKLKLNTINSNMNGFLYRPYVHDYCSPRGYGNGGMIIVGAPITAQPLSITLCEGATDSVSTNSSDLSALYEWEVLQNGTYIPVSGLQTNLVPNGRFLKIQNATIANDSTWVRCKLTGCSGISQTYTSPALIRVVQGAQIISQPAGYSLCDSNSAAISVLVQSSQLYSYRWYENNQLINGLNTNITGYNTPTLTFNPITQNENGKQYMCEILNAQCSLGTFTTPTQFQVNPNPVLTWSSAPIQICENASPLVLSGATPLGGIYSGVYINNGIFDPAGLAPYTYDAFYTYTDPSTGCSGSVFRLIKVDTVPQVQLSGLNDFYCTYHLPSTMTGIPLGGVFSGVGVAGNQFDPTNVTPGIWPIVYTFSDQNQCTSMDTFWVEVDDCSGITEIKNDPYQINPNPTSGKIHIKSASFIPDEITIYSLTGIILKQYSDIDQNPFTIDLSDFSNGFYILKIKQNEEFFFQKVFLNK